MARLRLIRHGQASFGAAVYDRLSEAGWTQARLTGAWLAERAPAPARVIHGTLERQRETADGIAEAFAAAGTALPPFEVHPGLNEYDADALMRAHAPELGRAKAHGDRRGHFRALGEALTLWQAAALDGAESWAAFEARVDDALAAACDAAGDGEVWLVTSGGVIGQAAARALEAGPAVMIRLHMQARNAGWTRLAGRPGRLWLTGFNEAPHLEAAGAETWS